MKKFTAILVSLFIFVISLGESQANEAKDKYFAPKCFDVHEKLEAINGTKFERNFSYYPIRKILMGDEYNQVIGIIYTKIQPWGEKYKGLVGNCLVFKNNTVSGLLEPLPEYWKLFGVKFQER